MHPKLLLADDSVTIQRVIELTFADEDVQVIAVGDGQQAIDRVRTERPDIVLADVGMPERDGYEVAAFIKGDPDLAHIPVLLLTGAFEPVDEARARAVGCDGVLVKPFEPQMVISRVRDLLAGNRGVVSGGNAGHAAAPPAAPTEPAGSLEDYFDRLDAALASKGVATPTLDPVPAAMAAPPPPNSIGQRPSLTVVPAGPGARATHTDLDLTGWNPPMASAPADRAVRDAQPDPPSMAPATPKTRPVEPPPQTAVASAPAPSSVQAAGPVNPVNLVTSATLDQAFAALLAAEQGLPPAPSSGRVAPAARDWSEMRPDAIPDSVVDAVVSKVIARMGDESMRSAVLDVAERLVREEIDRIKNAR